MMTLLSSMSMTEPALVCNVSADLLHWRHRAGAGGCPEVLLPRGFAKVQRAEESCRIPQSLVNGARLVSDVRKIQGLLLAAEFQKQTLLPARPGGGTQQVR